MEGRKEGISTVPLRTTVDVSGDIRPFSNRLEKTSDSSSVTTGDKTFIP